MQIILEYFVKLTALVNFYYFCLLRSSDNFKIKYHIKIQLYKINVSTITKYNEWIQQNKYYVMLFNLFIWSRL